MRRSDGSDIDAAARAIGVDTGAIERWLVQMLEAWRDASPDDIVEPWDYRYLNGAANRQLEASIPAQSLLPANERFYRDLGADLGNLARRLRPRFAAGQVTARLHRFSQAGQGGWRQWQSPVARVVGTYPVRVDFYSSNELVARERPRRARERDSHAARVHGLARHALHRGFRRRAFLERLRTRVATAIPGARKCRQRVSLRSLFGDVMLDVSPGPCSSCACCAIPVRIPMRSGPTSRADTCASSRTGGAVVGHACAARGQSRATW